MKSLKRNFLKIKTKNPYWSDYLCIAHTVRIRHFDNQTIEKYFEELVNPEEYAQDEKYQILRFLYSLTNQKTSWSK